MLELKPYRKGVDDAEEWIEKLSRVLEDNIYLEQLLSGKLVTKATKATYQTGIAVSGSCSFDGAVVCNESGADADFRVESDGNANMLFVDASTDRVGIGTASPSYPLDVLLDQAGYTYAQVKNTNAAGIAGFIATSDLGAVAWQSISSAEGTTGWPGYGRLRADAALNGLLVTTGGADPVILATSDVERFRVTGTEVVVNENGLSTIYFRVESDSDANNFYSDAANNRVGIGTDSPATKFDVRGVTRLGSAANYAEIEADGTLQFVGTATVWEDLRVEPIARVTGANAPAFTQVYTDGAGSRGVYLYKFDDAAGGSEKEIHFTVQMPHAWKGTSIYPHVHWIGLTADTTAEPAWVMEYTWTDIGADFANTTTVNNNGAKIGAGGATEADVVANRHYINPLDAIAPSASQDSISSVLIGRLYRDSAAVGDTYNAANADCYLLYIDFHYEVSTVGSRSEYTK